MNGWKRDSEGGVKDVSSLAGREDAVVSVSLTPYFQPTFTSLITSHSSLSLSHFTGHS